jgi:pimeloyl-ACP methyl ester carboxylesterase
VLLMGTFRRLARQVKRLARLRSKRSEEDHDVTDDSQALSSPPSGASPISRRIGSAIDHSVLRLMKGPSRYPKKDDYVRLQAEINHAYDLYKSQGIFERPHEFHRAPPILDSPDIKSVWHPKLRYEHVSFPSEYRPDPDDISHGRWVGYSPNHTAHAWALRHDDPSRPWLICLHGLGTGNPWMDFPGFRARKLHHELGYNLLFPVLPLHGPRKPADMGRGSLISFELLNTIHGLSQGIWDIRRLTDWITRQGGTRIGIYGMSMGAYAGALASSLVDAELVVCSIPLSDVPELFASHSTHGIRSRADAYGVLGDKVRELYRVVSPLLLTPRATVDNRFIIAGAGDRITPPSQARRLWEAWERPALHWFEGGHVSYFWNKQVDPFLLQALRRLGDDVSQNKQDASAGQKKQGDQGRIITT